MVSQRTLILECGADRASLAVFSGGGLRLNLCQLAVENFPAGSASNSSDDESWLEKIRITFRALRRKTRHRGAATLVLPAHLCLTKFIKVPRVSAGQREKILRFEVEQNIPHALSDVVWDSVVVAEAATETDLLLATAKVELLDALCDAANAVGFEIHAVLPAQCATLAGFKLLAGNNGGSFFGLNIGERASTLVLADSTRVALRTIALGWIDEGKMKLAGEEPFIARLQQEISRSLLHFQWRNGMTKPVRAFIAGSNDPIPGLVEAVSTRLKLPAEIGNFQHVLESGEFRGKGGAGAGFQNGDRAIHLLDLSGAAAAYFDSRHAKVNLLPPRMLARSNYRRRRPWLAAAALLAMSIAVPPILHFRALRDEAVKKSASIERELAPLRARDSRIQKNLRQIGAIRDCVRYYEAANERRASWLRFLTTLQAQLGEVEDVWLEKLQLAPPVANAPLKLLVSGRMLDRTRPVAKVSPETFVRVNALRSRLTSLPFIAAVESERFDNHQAGVLQFDFVLVADAQRPF